LAQSLRRLSLPHLPAASSFSLSFSRTFPAVTRGERHGLIFCRTSSGARVLALNSVVRVAGRRGPFWRQPRGCAIGDGMQAPSHDRNPTNRRTN
jgi:hypothetical protein